MFLRCSTLLIFLISIIFSHGRVFANTEVVFNNPTFGDISASASQTGLVQNSYPIAANTAASSEQYCTEKGMYFANYTVSEPTSFGTKAAYDSGGGIWETTPGTTKSASQIVCSTLPIIGLSVAGGLFSNNYWDTNFPGTGSGSVGGVVVTAQVLPTINMIISAEAIDLGTLTAGIEASGTLGIEVGTNAANGINITARSGSGGLTNTSDNSLQINDLVADGIAESYTFASTGNAIDSTVTGYTRGADLVATEINNNSTEHTIYSTNKPELDDSGIQDVTFAVSATSDAQTNAGNYQDTITFTVTGNF